MSKWYYKITQDLTNIIHFLSFYESELAQAKYELSLKGKTIEQHSAELPGIFENRFSQLQEIEAVLEYLNIQLSKKRSEVFKKFLEHYNRSLSSRDCEKYVDGDVDVVDSSLLINEVALIRNRYLAVIKGLDTKSFQLNNLIRLKCAGFDDFKIN